MFVGTKVVYVTEEEHGQADGNTHSHTNKNNFNNEMMLRPRFDQVEERNFLEFKLGDSTL